MLLVAADILLARDILNIISAPAWKAFMKQVTGLLDVVQKRFGMDNVVWAGKVRLSYFRRKTIQFYEV